MSIHTGNFTRRIRERKTRRNVRITDKISSFVITIGGIGTIIAILTVSLFLLWVAFPLLLPPSVSETHQAMLQNAQQSEEIITFGTDDDQTLCWTLSRNGTLTLFRLSDGAAISQTDLFENQHETRQLTAWSVSGAIEDAAFGFSDGTIQTGKIGFNTSYLNQEDLPEDFRGLETGQFPVVYDEGLLLLTPQGQYRLSKLTAEMAEPIMIEEEVPITRLDLSIRPTGPVLAILTRENQFFITTVREKKNFLTGEVTYTPARARIPYTPPDNREQPDFLRLSGLGDTVYLVWRDGYTLRYDTGNLNNPTLAETLYLIEENRLVDEAKTHITALEFLIGKSTLIAGDSQGRINAWFRIKPQNAPTPDGTVTVLAHKLPSRNIPVSSLAASARSRMLAAGYEDGFIRLFNVTNEYLMTELNSENSSPTPVVQIAPKDDGILAFSVQGVRQWVMDPKHPEITLRSLLLPIWYEGYNQPEYVWQSSSGTDQFEPKYSMIPLIFGTLKATFYSMLFGSPLALLAAIYTSEFLHPRIRSAIKPLIELMASLPSVVLGFLAALVFAPFVEQIVPAVLAGFITIPFLFLLGAYIWQILPQRQSIRLSRFRLLYIALLLPLGVLSAVLLGPVLETGLFAGDIKAWLDGQVGSAIGGWMILLIPINALLIAFANAQLVNPWLREHSMTWSRSLFAIADLSKLILAFLSTLGLSLLFAWLLTIAGFDPRGFFIATYVQRNALIVGFVMGFAIIPIIYTIAEDALSSVPDHLRSASLGCGATPWQTAMRIVIPTAMSGLFSAMMIGLGRAVGETMIVLMAAGNTPVLDWNIFNGFRTLSANIAVELPEAVRNSTHYRTLFLSALVLFAMTFVLNTIAEIIRLRFRKKAIEL
jgi:phosphate transport system permease protein